MSLHHLDLTGLQKAPTPPQSHKRTTGQKEQGHISTSKYQSTTAAVTHLNMGQMVLLQCILFIIL